MIVSVLVTLVGIILIGLVAFDVFITVLHPQAEGPFSSRLGRLIWRTMRLIARGLRGRTRHRFLGVAVPILIVALMASWILALILAFGMVYGPWINAPGAFRAADARPHDWMDGIYFSGITLTTVGYGDFQPVNPLLRVASVTEGFGGLVILTMSIAYVLEIYPVLQRQRVLAALLNEETGGHVNGLPMLARYLSKDKFEPLADLLRTVNLELLYLAESHRRLPVLHYVHPTDVEGSFLRILLVIRGLVAALRFGMSGGEGREWAEDPRVLDLEGTLFYALYLLGSSFSLPVSTLPNRLEAEADLMDAFGRLTTNLGSLGLPTPSKVVIDKRTGRSEYEVAVRTFLAFHRMGEPSLISYQLNSGYTLVEAIRDASMPQALILELETEPE